MGKKVAIVQSNYIPWKGYFDLIAAADEFILYDDVQYTRRDWRNRNQIKTPRGVEWLTVPVGHSIHRRICDVTILDHEWQQTHWTRLQENYRDAAHFTELVSLIAPLYLQKQHDHLSVMNRTFLETICRYLGITTHISSVADYTAGGDKSERLAELVAQAGGTTYISGPAAKDYLEEAPFAQRGIALHWYDYSFYPEYPQLWGAFTHPVSILDLLFNCGQDAPKFMHMGRK